MRVLYKKLFRDIRGARGSSAAIAAVVLSGAALYVAMAASYRNLLLTRDAYYSAYRFADFFISLERAPDTVRFRLESIPGVREVHGRIVQDVNLDIPGRDDPRSGRLVSLPDRPRPVINDIALMRGRYFEPRASAEVILSEAFARENGLEPGDTFQASIDNRKHTLRVVGTALSPEYVYTIRNPQELVPDAAAFGILWVTETFAEQALNMQGARNDFVGLADEGADIEAILERAEGILEPYGVFSTLDAKDQISNNFLTSEIEGLGVSARILPSVFFGVAAAVLLVLLSRMVRQERMQIGLLKAYGYTNAAVAGHYIRFALLLSTAGTAAGVLAGLVLARWMVQLYQQFFEFPLLRSRAHPDVIFNAFVLGALFAVAGAVSAARRAARIPPAEALQPEAPRTGTRTGLERWPALWSRLSFTGKMIARNVSRYKLRAAFTVVGVMLSASMVLIGQFSTDAMDYLIAFQFSVTQREDIRVGLESERGKGALYDFARLEHVRRAEPLLAYPFRIGHGWREKDIAVTGLLPDAELFRLVDTEGRRVAVDGPGLIVDDKLADDLGLEAGDTVTLEPLLGRVKGIRRARVARIVPQYLGTGAYMDLHALSRLLDEPFAMNAALLRTERGQARAVARDLKDVAAIASVTVKEDAYDSLMETLGGTMRASNVIIALFASIIAFAIIYNSTLVSLMERRRELASLRVLGFTSREVGRILYYENVVLSIAGLVLGLPVGAVLCRLLVEAYETEMYRLPFHITPRAFVYTAILTLVFVGLANFAAHRKVLRLDMVEVLKSRE